MIDINDLRKIFAEHLYNNANERHSMDAALMHVSKLMFAAGWKSALSKFEQQTAVRHPDTLSTNPSEMLEVELAVAEREHAAKLISPLLELLYKSGHYREWDEDLVDYVYREPAEATAAREYVERVTKGVKKI